MYRCILFFIGFMIFVTNAFDLEASDISNYPDSTACSCPEVFYYPDYPFDRVSRRGETLIVEFDMSSTNLCGVELTATFNPEDYSVPVLAFDRPRLGTWRLILPLQAVIDECGASGACTLQEFLMAQNLQFFQELPPDVICAGEGD